MGDGPFVQLILVIFAVFFACARPVFVIFAVFFACARPVFVIFAFVISTFFVRGRFLVIRGSSSSAFVPTQRSGQPECKSSIYIYKAKLLY